MSGRQPPTGESIGLKKDVGPCPARGAASMAPDPCGGRRPLVPMGLQGSGHDGVGRTENASVNRKQWKYMNAATIFSKWRKHSWVPGGKI